MKEKILETKLSDACETIARWDDDNGGIEVIRETYTCFGGVEDGKD